MAANLTFTTYDRLNKVTSMSFNAATLVDAGDVQDVADAIDAIIRGTAVKATSSIVTVVDQGVAGPSTDIDADRGNKWLVRIQDDVSGIIYTHELGTADNGVLPSADSDFIDLSGGVGQDFKDAVEVVYESPDGNAGTVLSVQQVNRALN
jgi:hypothetical protein